MLPDDNELPISTYQAKKLTCPMDLETERIDACPNDCMLYRGNDKDLHASKGKRHVLFVKTALTQFGCDICRKMIYMGHRRSLLRNHPYRKKKDLFDGTIERGELRPPLDGEATSICKFDILDVMHIEKNVCESLVGLLLNFLGKTKDGVNVRNDMEDMGIQPELAAKLIPGKRD
ncbi:hypothetical protein Tco_0753785 [Tanacetum coccineum]